MLNLYNILQEQLLTEDKASKNIDKAKKFLRANGVQDAQQIIDAIRHDIPNVRMPKDENGKDTYNYILGVARLFLEKELANQNKMEILDRCLPYLCKEENINKYPKNLEGLRVDDIYNTFKEQIQQDLEQDKLNSQNREHNRNEEYEIVQIPTPEDASEYGEYTDWCVTHYPEYYWNYTHNGTGVFYFCLKNGFEDIPRRQGENCPLDEYGLSMIAVSVNADGSPNTITCRWNHAQGGNDHVMSTEELEKVLGVNFYETFLPLDEETIRDREENPPMEDEEMSEEERMEEYYNERYADGICVFNVDENGYDNLYLYKVFDDNYDWDETLSEYYVYTYEDDQHPVTYEEFEKDCTIVYENKNLHAIALESKYNDVILFWQPQEGGDYEVFEDFETVGQLTSDILFAINRRGDVVFLHDANKCGRAEIGAEAEDTEIFVNSSLPPKGGFFVEIKNYSGEHYLLQYDQNEEWFKLIIDGDYPENGEQFILSEDGLVHTEYDEYNIYSETASYSTKQYSLHAKLQNGMFLVAKYVNDNEVFSIYNPKERKNILPDFLKLNCYSNQYGLFNVFCPDKIGRIYNSNGQIVKESKILQSLQAQEEASDGKWNGDALSSNDPKTGITIYLYQEQQDIVVKTMKEQPRNGLLKSWKYDGTPFLFDYINRKQLFPNAKTMKEVGIAGYLHRNKNLLIIDNLLFDITKFEPILANVNEAETIDDKFIKIEFVDNTQNLYDINTKQMMFKENCQNISTLKYIIVAKYQNYALGIQRNNTSIPMFDGQKFNPNFKITNDCLVWHSDDNKLYIRTANGVHVEVAINGKNGETFSSEPYRSSIYQYQMLSQEEKQMVDNFLFGNNITETFKRYLKRIDEARKMW